MEQKTELHVVFEYERSTKGTHRYQEVSETTEPIIGSLYIRKWAVGQNAPDRLTLTIQEGEVGTYEGDGG